MFHTINIASDIADNKTKVKQSHTFIALNINKKTIKSKAETTTPPAWIPALLPYSALLLKCSERAWSISCSSISFGETGFLFRKRIKPTKGLPVLLKNTLGSASYSLAFLSFISNSL